jgi:hypothetical protein
MWPFKKKEVRQQSLPQQKAAPIGRLEHVGPPHSSRVRVVHGDDDDILLLTGMVVGGMIGGTEGMLLGGALGGVGGGIIGGEIWRTFPDWPHFQLTGSFPVSPNDAARALLAGGGLPDVWKTAFPAQAINVDASDA